MGNKTSVVDVRRKTRFFMIENDALAIIGSVGRTAFCLYCALMRYANQHGECFPTIARLAADIDTSVRTVQYELRKLEEAGYITTTDVLDGPSIYTVHDPSTLAASGANPEACNPAPTSEPMHDGDCTGATCCTTPVQSVAPVASPPTPPINTPVTESKLQRDSVPVSLVEQDPVNKTNTLATREISRALSADASPACKTWAAYCEAFVARYGVPPTRNAKVNGQIAQFLKRIPHDDAPCVAAFYVRNSDAFYVKAAHSVGLLLRDAEKLHVEWQRGRRVTTQEARDVDRLESTFEMLDRVAAKIGRAKMGPIE